MADKSPAYNAPTEERLDVVMTVRFSSDDSRDIVALAVREDRTRANVVRRLVKDQLDLMRSKGQVATSY